jgi:hypothetical protein
MAAAFAMPPDADLSGPEKILKGNGPARFRAEPRP